MSYTAPGLMIEVVLATGYAAPPLTAPVVLGQNTTNASARVELLAPVPSCVPGGLAETGSLAAAAAVYNDSLYNDTPNASPSNVSVPISSACLEDGTEVLMDQEQGNVLNEQGVATFIRSGDFVVWGNETCCYPKNTDPKDAFLCVRRFFNHS